MNTKATGALVLAAFVFCLQAMPVYAEESAAKTDPKLQYETTMQQRLSSVGKQLDELKAKAGTKAADARKEVNQYFSDADKKREAAAKELDSLRSATNEKWEQVKPRLNKAVDDFEKAIEKAKDKLHHE
jgi:hypothetical protein